MENLLHEVGNRIWNRRKQLHYTQEKLAELANVTTQTIASAENGTKQLRMGNLYSICKALETSSDYLLFGTEEDSDIDSLIKIYPFLTREQASDLKIISDTFVKQLKP